MLIWLSFEFYCAQTVARATATNFELKKQHNRFHAIGCQVRKPELMSLFDHCWAYHPNWVDG